MVDIHISTVDELLKNREAQGLRVPVTARFLFGLFGILSAFASPMAAGPRLFLMSIAVPLCLFNIYLFFLLRNTKRIKFVGITGMAMSAFSVFIYPFLMYHVSQPIEPIAMISKMPPLLAVCMVFIIIETLALRPLYPIVVTCSALISHLAMILLSYRHPAATWSNELENMISSTTVSLTGVVTAMMFLMIAGTALSWLARSARRTVVKAAELEADRIRIIRDQANLLTQSRIGVLEEFVVSISHEMNNPLGAVKSNAETSRRAAGRIRENMGHQPPNKGSAEKIEQVLGALEQTSQSTLEATDRMETTLKTLRSFARLDEAEYKQVDIHEALESTLALIPPETIGDIQIERHYTEVPQINAYAGRLNQVFMILLSNAFEVSGEKGTVALSTGCTAGNASIRISDTGPGIPEEELGHIFEIRLSPGQSRVEAGFGIAACHSIVSQHRGQLLAESTVGKGTTFTIVLPVA
jgi:signal transduction histidine kinase